MLVFLLYLAWRFTWEFCCRLCPSPRLLFPWRPLAVLRMSCVRRSLTFCLISRMWMQMTMIIPCFAVNTSRTSICICVSLRFEKYAAASDCLVILFLARCWGVFVVFPFSCRLSKLLSQNILKERRLQEICVQFLLTGLYKSKLSSGCFRRPCTWLLQSLIASFRWVLFLFWFTG